MVLGYFVSVVGMNSNQLGSFDLRVGKLILHCPSMAEIMGSIGLQFIRCHTKTAQ